MEFSAAVAPAPATPVDAVSRGAEGRGYVKTGDANAHRWRASGAGRRGRRDGGALPVAGRAARTRRPPAADEGAADEGE
ncbi:MAG: hypothetical protein ACLT98_15320 [Eggerthellaceae bacterium]